MWGDYPRMYLISGKDLPDIHAKFMKLQGLPNVPPKNVFGWKLSKFGYENWKEPFDDLRDLKSKNFLLPSYLAMDLQWFGENFRDANNPKPSDNTSRMGLSQPDENAFPNFGVTTQWLKTCCIGVIPIQKVMWITKFQISQKCSIRAILFERPI